MKKTLMVIMILIAIASLAACSNNANNEVEETTIGTTDGNDDFTLSIWATNSEYKADEEIVCHGMVTYMGTEAITVLHSDPLLVFYIEGGELFSGDWARNDSLNRTTFAPEQEVVLPFQKSGGWSADDPDAAFYEAFYADKELRLPAGEYTLTALMEYSTDENDMPGTMQTLSVSVTVTATD